MNLKISIIVPVYKVELYLEKCIDSILVQTFKDFELILVNDGSPDRCGEICDKYAKKDSRIKVIHKENGGQSSARNKGLDISKGEYIGFVDSDDWIEPEMYQILYDLIIFNNADVAVCDAKYITNLKIEQKEVEIEKRILESNEEVLKALFEEKYLLWSPWNKLYKKNKIKDIRFLEGRIYEDVPFLIEYFNEVKKAVYINKKLYNYFALNTSTTRSQIGIKHLSLLKNPLYTLKIVKEPYKQNILDSIYSTTKNICSIIVNEKSIIRNRIILNKIKDILKTEKHLIDNIKLARRVDKFQFTIIKISPFYFCVIYRIGKEIKKIFKRG